MQLLTVFTEALYHIQIVSYCNGIKPANFNQKKTNQQRTDKIADSHIQIHGSKNI